ncbi:PREDICTED: uncharacterized protein LOC101293269 [Fragaria vesca subsp. vesca]|uniref:uncharacterized protein LOC101293269 n=1 Tax=Fragaria vesca subsp. vesca TaxID=101020 RepID=UPI0002C2FDFA|nr:PREDICTED: uncharacterized protein LOC101293269 [Fragaria vesca subsp. vesca]
MARNSLAKSFPTGHMNRRDCVGSIEEWLIMVDSAVWRPEGFMKPWSLYLQCNSIPIDYFFLNPISGSTVMLPSSPSTLPCNCDYTPLFLFTKVVASSVPTNQHCFVASLCKRGHLALCRPADRLWTFIDGSFIDQGEARNLLFQDVEIFYGKLYAATWDASNFLMVFDIQYDNGIPRYTTERLVMLHPNPVPNMFLNVTITNNGVRVETNRELISLAKDSTSHELFLIFRRHNFAFEEDPIFLWHAIFGGTFIIPPHIPGFRVFKLERHLKGPRWVEVFNLGDQILFVSRAGNKFISTSNISDYNEAFERNCIYFAFNNPCFASPSLGLDVGVFSLTNKSIRCFTFPKDHSRSQLHSRPVWFTPKFW